MSSTIGSLNQHFALIQQLKQYPDLARLSPAVQQHLEAGKPVETLSPEALEELQAAFFAAANQLAAEQAGTELSIGGTPNYGPVEIPPSTLPAFRAIQGVDYSQAATLPASAPAGGKSGTIDKIQEIGTKGASLVGGIVGEKIGTYYGGPIGAKIGKTVGQVTGEDIGGSTMKVVTGKGDLRDYLTVATGLPLKTFKKIGKKIKGFFKKLF